MARASDSIPEGLGSPPNTLRVHTDSMPKFWTWRSVVLTSTVKIYRPFGDFTELNRTVTCIMLKGKANDKRTSSPLPR
ncbi:hypothetical protein TNCV_297021 [Trichonephila clavipes]|nr:hypothetical protein TNCV_297021 [Trichonephila clavipes]